MMLDVCSVSKIVPFVEGSNATLPYCRQQNARFAVNLRTSKETVGAISKECTLNSARVMSFDEENALLNISAK
jgi:hypothetical protein